MTILGKPVDYYAKCKAILEVDGVIYAGFKTCSAIVGKIDKREHREGGDPDPFIGKGNNSYDDVTLERGLSENHELYDWWNSCRNGAVDRRTARLIQRNDADEDVEIFTLKNAWPHTNGDGGWDISAGSDTTVEQIIICFERFEREAA